MSVFRKRLINSDIYSVAVQFFFIIRMKQFCATLFIVFAFWIGAKDCRNDGRPIGKSETVSQNGGKKEKTKKSLAKPRCDSEDKQAS